MSNEATPAKPGVSTAGANSPSLGISDIVADMGLPPGVVAAALASEQPDAAAAKAKAEAEAAAKAAADKKAAEGAAPTKPEFSADQQAWLDLRAAATDEAEIKKLESEMPEFTDAQRDYLNAEADQAEAATKTAAEKGAAAEPKFDDTQKAWLKEKFETPLATAQAEAKAATEKAAALEAQLRTAGAKPQAIAPMHPLLLVESPVDLDKKEAELSAFEKWALENWDGTEAVEASADGKTPAREAIPAAKVRSAYARVKEEREKIIPAARQYLASYIAENAAAKAVYPELFDEKHPHAQIAQGLLKQLPGLRVAIPNIMTVIGDAIVGEQLRLEKAKAAEKKGKAAQRPGIRIPPKGGAGGAPKLPGTKPAAASAAPSVDKFHEAMKRNGGDEKAALMEIL